jgi:hypothetical protein
MPVLMDEGLFSWGLFKDEESVLIDGGVTPLITAEVCLALSSRAADSRPPRFISGARLKFCMTDGDVRDEADETEFTTII